MIAPSFGDIFRQNALKIGLLPVALPPEEVGAASCADERELTVDLERTVDVDARRPRIPFEIDPFRRATACSRGSTRSASRSRTSEAIAGLRGGATRRRVDTTALPV